MLSPTTSMHNNELVVSKKKLLANSWLTNATFTLRSCAHAGIDSVIVVAAVTKQ